MGHRGPSAAPGWERVRVQACEALAAHRRGDRTHTHIHTAAHESMADARSPIGATRHLVFPGHRFIHTPARQRTLTPCGTLAFSTRNSLRACPLKPEPSQRSRRKPSASSAVQTAGVVVMRRRRWLSHKLILLLQLAHPPTHSSDLSVHLAWIRTALTHSLAPLALECDPPAHHRFTQPSIPGHRRDRRPRIQHQRRNITTILRRQTTTRNHNRHLTGRRHTHPLNEVSTTPA